MAAIDATDFTALRHRMIVVTAAAEVLPPPFAKQLADGGRMVLPLGDAHSQSSYRFTKDGERSVSEDLGVFVFVPSIGRLGRIC